MNNHNGERVWLEQQQFNALFKGKGGKAGKGGARYAGDKGARKGGTGGKGGMNICKWCYKTGHRSNECEDKTKYFKERGLADRHQDISREVVQTQQNPERQE